MFRYFTMALILAGLALPGIALAQPPAESPPTADSITDIIFAGGLASFLIIGLLLLLSIAGLALGVEHALTIRRAAMMPDGLEAELHALLKQGQAGAAIQKCDATPSALAALVRGGLQEADTGWPAVEKGMEEEAAEQAARLFRKIEYLSVIGNIAPMLGLLGTVIGMILAFREVADTQGAARAAQLASGIYQALVTTVGGLLVAIPSLAAYAVFRNRVDALMAETVVTARRVLGPVKRALLGRQASGIPTTRRSSATDH